MLTKRIASPLVPLAPSMFPGGQPIDLVSLDDVKLELGITNTTDDAWLALIITRCSTAAETYCNRVFQPSMWMDQVWPGRDAYPYQLPPRIDELSLWQWPILSAPSPAQTAPPQAPTLSAGAGGALAAAIYYVRTTYLTASGETAASLESRISLPAGQLFAVAAPGPDQLGVAIAWNVYASSTPFTETLQNAAPISLMTGWALPPTGLVAGEPAPDYVTIVENTILAPTSLTESVDFEIDETLGKAHRFFRVDRQPQPWGLPVTAIYTAGFDPIPPDVQDAVLLMVKARWFSRTRDPAIKSQNAVGIYQASYNQLAAGTTSATDMPSDAQAKLDQYRRLVIA
jgi:hypothetical protein